MYKINKWFHRSSGRTKIKLYLKNKGGFEHKEREEVNDFFFFKYYLHKLIKKY